MKKQLLGTTAMVAAGLFVLADAGPASAQQKVEPIKVSVGGYFGAFVSYTDQDDVCAGGDCLELDQHNDSEIIFNGSTTLANGIRVGFQTQLEGNTSSDTIDEVYMFLESKFGRLELGSLNNVHYRMGYKAPDVFSRGWISSEGNITNVMAGISGGSATTINTSHPRLGDNDSEKINIYTPRFAGFQIGASYIPDSRQDDQAAAPVSTAYTRGWSAAANYVQTFGDFSVAASAGYYTWQGAQNAALGITNPDPDIYSFGLQVGYAGFRVGGSWGQIKDGRSGTDGVFNAASQAGSGSNLIEGEAWDIGISYTFGPASVSVTYFEGNNDHGACNAAGTCTSLEDEFTAAGLAGKYVIGPGISVEGVLWFGEVDNAGTTSDNEAAGLVAGVVLVF